MITWIVCHIFGRHKFHVDIEKTGKNINYQLTCRKCDFEMSSAMKLTPIGKLRSGDRYKHLEIIK